MDKTEWLATDRTGVWCGHCDQFLGFNLKDCQFEVGGGTALWPIHRQLAVIGFESTGVVARDTEGYVFHECGSQEGAETGNAVRLGRIVDGVLTAWDLPKDGPHRKVRHHIPNRG